MMKIYAMMYDNLTLLVSSCDKYAVCWNPFVHGLQKYWPDHPRTIFITNKLQPEEFESIQIYPDRGWADNLIFALEKIDSPYILYAQEDYWISRPIDQNNITDYLDLLRGGLVDYIRLRPAPPPDTPFMHDTRLGVISPHSRYRTSLQMALWRKSVLRDLLMEKESPWRFEEEGSRRSMLTQFVFTCVRSISDGVSYTFTAIINGEWAPCAYEYAKEESVFIDYSKLPSKSFGRKLKDHTYRKLYRLKRKLVNFSSNNK